MLQVKALLVAPAVNRAPTPTFLQVCVRTVQEVSTVAVAHSHAYNAKVESMQMSSNPRLVLRALLGGWLPQTLHGTVPLVQVESIRAQLVKHSARSVRAESMLQVKALLVAPAVNRAPTPTCPLVSVRTVQEVSTVAVVHSHAFNAKVESMQMSSNPQLVLRALLGG
jgi:hypothetical protein